MKCMGVLREHDLNQNSLSGLLIKEFDKLRVCDFFVVFILLPECVSCLLGGKTTSKQTVKLVLLQHTLTAVVVEAYSGCLQCLAGLLELEGGKMHALALLVFHIRQDSSRCLPISLSLSLSLCLPLSLSVSSSHMLVGKDCQ